MTLEKSTPPNLTLTSQLIDEAGGGGKPELKELDRLKLERLNLSISNLNLQIALLNERARTLQKETAGFRAEREGLVNNIILTMMANNELAEGWRLNPDTLIFEAVGVGLPPAPTK